MEEVDRVKVACKSQVEGRRARERQWFKWRDGFKGAMRHLGLVEEEEEDSCRKYWRQHTRAVDPTKNKG